MAAAGNCKRCGALLAGDAMEGLCPACMLQAGLPTVPTGAQPTIPKLDVSKSEAETPRFIAGYQIFEEIGHGGMGIVYLADKSSRCAGGSP